MKSLAPILLALTLAGCGGTIRENRIVGPATTQPSDSLVLSANIAHAVRAWRPVAEARWGKGNVFILVVHGWTNPATHRWMACPDTGAWLDMETVARVLSEEHRDKVVLCITCNEGHVLHDPLKNVYYADRAVWSMPHCLFHGDSADKISDFHN